MYAYALDGRRLRRRRPVPRWKVVTRRIGLGVGVFVITLFAMAHSVHGSSTGGYLTVTVQPGDTVWSIASRRYPESDTREKVQEILQANGLEGPGIYAGERLKVPTT